MIKAFFIVIIGTVCVFCSGCTNNFNLFSTEADPLQECVISGTGPDKILLLNAVGTISDSPEEDGMFKPTYGMVQELSTQINKASTDPSIKAVILKIDSPGGTITGSDILYHELMKYKDKTGIKIVAIMMNVAASGGYYIALPADRILAHPTTVTGSIGAVFMRPDLTGLLEKVGVNMVVNKSGDKKDIGSPFRQATEEEKRIMNQMILEMGGRFVNLVRSRRTNITDEAIKDISSARIYTSNEALKLGLIDEIGYMDDAIDNACRENKLDRNNTSLITYRRTIYADESVYNNAQFRQNIQAPDASIIKGLSVPTMSGFYYIWIP